MVKIEFRKEELIKSPMNYVGGKFKLLPQILPIFPNNIDKFVDLFGGGLDVSINIKANDIICNDIIKPIIELYGKLKDTNINNTLKHIQDNINTYSLSKQNKEGYLKLREYYNTYKNPLDLMTLIAYCYNNQIRFNSKWGFNRAFGENRSEFNPTMESNLVKMVSAIQSNRFSFVNKSFEEFDYSILTKDDFIYADPPYLITNADYSIQAMWNEDKEKQLLNILDLLNNKGVKFAVSNVIEHDGKTNYILKEWSQKYIIHSLNHNYSNANADKKVKKGKSQEVLITNY